MCGIRRGSAHPEKDQSPGLFFAALYIRLSREDGDKEESDSVGNQRKLLTEYIRGERSLVLHDIYIDDGYTGTNFGRPEFLRMIGDIEAGKVNCVIVKDLSRFGRDYIETGRYLERYFPQAGVRFISVTDQIDSISRPYDLLLPIKNIFNEQYAKDISRKVQAAVKARQKAGEFIGAFASYGYKKSPADKNKLVVDEYAAGVVRRIFSLYLQGYGKQTIAKILNAEEILCPSEYKRISGLNYRNPNRREGEVRWSYAAVNSILHKEMYVGNMVQGTKHQCVGSRQKKTDKADWIVVACTHEPIIDRETWEKTQRLLKKRTRTPGQKMEKNIFAGFVKCADCNRAMVRNSWKCADGSRRYMLYCGTYKKYGKAACAPHALPADDLERIILDDLEKLLRSTDDLEQIVGRACAGMAKTGKSAEEEIRRLDTEQKRVQRWKQSVYEDYKEALITKEEFLDYREDYRKKEAFYAEQRKCLEKRKAEEEHPAATQWIRTLIGQKKIERLDRAVVAELIHEIRVGEGNRVKIVYKFSKEENMW